MLQSLRSGLLAVGVFGATLSYAAPHVSGTGMATGAIYTLDNNPNNATIVAVGMADNGTLIGSPVSTLTGGKGGSGQTRSGQPNVGSLFSSNAIAAGDDYLFAVNAGSNTVSMFNISATNATNLTLVGQPADTLGDFPVSVSYSSALKMLCVLNGGATNGVICFNVDPQKGLTTNDKAPRNISKALNQTTPPTGPFSTASQIQFNPSSSAVFVSVKGSPLTKPVSPGYIYAWRVEGGQVGTTPVISQLDSVILDFSLSFFETDFELLITDPALGADILGVSSTLDVSVQAPIKITYQKAACWSYYDNYTDLVYVMDAAQTNVTVINAQNGSIAQTIDFNSTYGGGQDVVVLGTNLYVVTSKGPIANIDLSAVSASGQASKVQVVDPVPASQLGADTIQGIAWWKPSS